MPINKGGSKMKRYIAPLAVILAVVAFAGGPYFSTLYTKVAIINTGTLTQTGTSTFTGVATFNSAPVIKYASLTNTSDSSYAITSADYGKVLATSYAGEQFITLPAPGTATIGVHFWVTNLVDQTLWILPAAANTIISDGTITSDKVSFATGSHKIGARALIIGISATKWLIINESVGCTMTVAA
jgi:hypothetical protein